MNSKDKAWLGFCLVFSFAGTLFGVIAYINWRSTNQIVRDGIQTQGIVIENRYKEPFGLQRRSTAMAPVVQFRMAEGTPITYYSQTYTNPVQFEVGETVSIWYMPNNPQQAALDGADSWLLPLVFGVFGAVFGLIGYSLLISFLLSLRRKSAVA